MVYKTHKVKVESFANRGLLRRGGRGAFPLKRSETHFSIEESNSGADGGGPYRQYSANESPEKTNPKEQNKKVKISLFCGSRPVGTIENPKRGRFRQRKDIREKRLPVAESSSPKKTLSGLRHAKKKASARQSVGRTAKNEGKKPKKRKRAYAYLLALGKKKALKISGSGNPGSTRPSGSKKNEY